MVQYNVTGMSCAACSARVEKAVSKLDGVTTCSVSLLTNSMGVEGTAAPEDVIKAVENAGYGASLKDENKGGVQKEEAPSFSKETKELKIRLVTSLVFLLFLIAAKFVDAEPQVKSTTKSPGLEYVRIRKSISPAGFSV